MSLQRNMRILIDCDGVLGDFVTPYLELIRTVTGDRHMIDEVTQFDVLAALGKKDVEAQVLELCSRRGFCSSFKTLPGAVEGVAALRELGDLFVVTSPMHVPWWTWERTEWLSKHFGFTKKQVLYTSSKEIVSGDVMIDDNEVNLIEWQAEQRRPDYEVLPLLVDSPWNRNVEHPGVVRMRNWDEIVLWCAKWGC